MEVPAFDLTQNYRSLWNSKVLELLLQELQQRCKDEDWPIKKTDSYLREVLQNRYKKLRTIWTKAQPKLTKNGVQETPEEVEVRLVEEMTKMGKASRQATRRRNVGHPSGFSLTN